MPRLVAATARQGCGARPIMTRSKMTRYNHCMKNFSALTVLLLSSYVVAQTPAEKLVAQSQLSPALEKNLPRLIGGRTR